jgi:hypothetical protein
MSCYRTEMALFQTDLCSNHKPVRSRGLYQWVGRGSTANNGLYLGEGDHSHDQHMFVSPVVTRGYASPATWSWCYRGIHHSISLSSVVASVMLSYPSTTIR